MKLRTISLFMSIALFVVSCGSNDTEEHFDPQPGGKSLDKKTEAKENR